MKRDSLEDRAEWWRDWLDERSEEQADLDPDSGGLDPTDLIAFAAAGLQMAVDRALVEVDSKTNKQGAGLNGRVSVLQLRLRELEADRQRQAAEASAMRAHIGRLEAENKAAQTKLAETAKAIANLQFELARDRAWRRMLDERKFAPIVETVAIEQAKKRTQAAIEGRS